MYLLLAPSGNEESSTAVRVGATNHLELSGHDSLTCADRDRSWSHLCYVELCNVPFGKSSEHL